MIHHRTAHCNPDYLRREFLLCEDLRPKPEGREEKSLASIEGVRGDWPKSETKKVGQTPYNTSVTLNEGLIEQIVFRKFLDVSGPSPFVI